MELLGRRTLLFTDIEGSTALLQRVGHPQFVELMDRHHEIMRTAIRNNSGEEIRNEGDGFVVFFPDPLSGLNCAIECQRRLREGPWPPEAAISVRMGLHEGEIGFSESGHHGLALHEAARVSSAAHGGQVLLSEAARDSVGNLLPEETDIDLIELGTFPLKDLGPRVPLIQIAHPDLEHDFPLPQSSGGGQNNLPSQLTSLIGREGDADDVDELVRSHRLVTLLGSGGVGKTRLALQVGANLGAEFSDGVWLVELAPIEDATLIFDEIRRAMRIPDDGQGERTLIDAVHEDNVLVILDNCEHILDGVAEAVDLLLRECPGIRILATSREPIGTPGEARWRVPSLPTADAVDLMIERARLVAPELDVSEEERLVLNRVCRRLDGIPLAVELVAGRLGTIPIEEIESRLLDRLRLLSTGSRGYVPRHKTLHAALDWSYQLLTADEQTLLTRLAIFPGPLELAAAEAVCSDGALDEYDVMDLLESLHMKSLISMDWSRKPPMATRSEIVSQFADALLDQTSDRERLAAKHADHYFDLSEEAAVGLRRTNRTEWLDRIDAGRENLGAAYDWLAQNDPDRAAVFLMNVKEWLITSMSSAWLARVRDLAERDDVAPKTIAAVNALRAMLSGFFDFESTAIAASASRRAYVHIDAVIEPRERIRVMTNLAAGFRESEPDIAAELAELALAEAETLGIESHVMATTLDLLTVHDEHHEMSRRLRSSALELMEANEEWASVHPLVDGALAMHQTGEHDQALRWLARAENMLPRVPQAGGLMTEDAKVWMIWSVLIRAEIGDTDTAILLAEDGLRAFGDGHVLYTKTLTSNYGQALLVAGRADEARAAFESTLELDSAERYVSFAIASLGLARLDLDAGNLSDAAERLMSVATQNRRAWVRARAHELLAVCCMRLQRWDEAQTHVAMADSLRQPDGFAVPPAFAAEAELVRNELEQRTL